jgi:hypothetical protein
VAEQGIVLENQADAPTPSGYVRDVSAMEGDAPVVDSG